MRVVLKTIHELSAAEKHGEQYQTLASLWLHISAIFRRLICAWDDWQTKSDTLVIHIALFGPFPNLKVDMTYY